ncbi:hypothetical protein CERZMDRAFT_109476 [Cercospora zeae-maydis SCOH1-5]|uniref:Zn(2)-C6 fungal-type domain-containing protein n=1 Tax=Cercospora zeae-maydis SCOH1-5 TaxID=717836 RepID=A0A6A6FT78_9PEZI|nr:hypothetical protein CERZMDRAFT_109476 [Cercospora zeae-maydis SCOH1-5]
MDHAALSDAPAAAATPQPKALRFVTNYGAPHPKRRRIGAACLTCRKRKTACSGERPTCETCKQNKLECAGYSESTAPPAHTHNHSRSDSDTSNRRPSQQNTASKSQAAAPSHVKISRTPDDDAPSHDQVPNDLSRTLSGGQSPRTAVDKRPPSSDEPPRSENGKSSMLSASRNRVPMMPYFRWLGPTAIMPGFKQMVVKLKRTDTDGGMRTSTDGGVRSPSLNDPRSSERNTTSIYSATPAAVESDARTPLTLPFYDTSRMPPSELITHLVNTFFTHLGCNYPFLQRDRFIKDLEEKQVDPVLVDAVCALAARFSTHSLLTQIHADGEKQGPAEYGHAFAQRAKSALTDTFPCPSVAAAQAALLLAYNEFGEQRDSGLWMYLGISIRLAQDLGLHKLEGLKYVGRDGPTPRMVKSEQRNSSKAAATPGTSASGPVRTPSTNESIQSPEERQNREDARSVEQERVDTFWAIFFLDRVVSSGTGRRSTLRDKDIEISLPSLTQTHDRSGWPAPFPALIRIVHLYGRVADLLNSIKEPSDITAETPKRLAAMESQVTTFYQNLSPRLHFDAVNFQHYMKAGEGTNFVLLHFWFHTLIVILHQPTLLKTFAGRMLQLFPNSQQLSMSSAKTIADILSYSQLMDAKASLGNPFTSQPIYIAACAFLRETVEQTATSNAQSRSNSPNHASGKAGDSDSAFPSAETPHDASRKASIASITAASDTLERRQAAGTAADKSQLAKHTLLATAASQHYQLCYKALQSLETYWSGTKYILTVLDQKFEGVGDPLLYTVEEGESSMEQPRPEPEFTSPGWRRKLSWGAYISNPALPSPFWPPSGFTSKVPGSPRDGVDPSKAIGWTFSGDMNSNSTNLAWHFAGDETHNSNIDPRLNPSASSASAAAGKTQQNPSNTHARGSSGISRVSSQDNVPRQVEHARFSNVSNSDAENLLALSSPYNQHNTQASAPSPMTSSFQQHGTIMPSIPAPSSSATQPPMNGQSTQTPLMMSGTYDFSMNFLPGNMMIETQDVDMNMLGLEAMPWFDPHPDMLHLFDPNQQAPGGSGNHAQGHGRR